MAVDWPIVLYRVLCCVHELTTDSSLLSPLCIDEQDGSIEGDLSRP